MACPLPSTVSHKNWSFRAWFVGITIPVEQLGRVLLKTQFLAQLDPRDARNMVPPFIYHFGWVENPSVGCFNPKKPCVYLVFLGEVW